MKKRQNKKSKTRLISYELFYIIPIWSVQSGRGNAIYKFLGIPVWHVRKIAATKTVKYYLFGLPVLSDTWE